MKVKWTNSAVDHLISIHEYISQNSEIYANNVLEKLIDRSEQLNFFPNSGRVVPEYKSDKIRELIENPYRIIYLIKEGQIDILAVIHTAQQIKNKK